MEASSSIEFSGRGVRKGPWCEEEDLLLRKCIEKYGEGKWGQVPLKAGLNRCRKSCRLRWCNYLKPNIKRGEFEADELDLIMRMHKLLGNRWSIIAGRLPGRTANDIKNYYNTRLKKKCFFQSNAEAEQVVIVKKLGGQTNNDHNHCRRVQKGKQPCTDMSTAAEDCDSNRMRTKVLKPLPRSFTYKSQMITSKASSSTGTNNGNSGLGTRISDINDKESVTNDMTTLVPKKPKKKKKNKGITTRSAVVDFENVTSSSLGAEEGMKFTVGDKSKDQHVYYSNFFDGDQRADEGGNEDDYWNDLYFDYNSWGALGEEQDLIF